MLPLVIALSALTVALAAVVVWQRHELQEHAKDADAGHDVSELKRPGRDVIVIDIRNHAEVAGQRVKIARTIARITPGIIRGLVHRETIRQVKAQLAQEGVVAEVRVRRIVEHRPLPVVTPAPVPPIIEQVATSPSVAATPEPSPDPESERPPEPELGEPT